MNPYAPPKAAEKIMNERTVKMSHGWRRVKRRIRILTRKIRPIANSPEIAFWQRDRLARPALRVPRRAPCAADNHAAMILKKCLRRCDVAPSDENMVDKALRAPQSEAAARRLGIPLAPTTRAAASRAVKRFECTK